MQDSGSPVLLEHLFRRESGRIVAWLAGLLGSAHLQLAEDAAQEAMLRAAETWPFQGWATTPGGTVAYTNTASYPFTSDGTLYAVWTAMPMHTVKFMKNGGTGVMGDEVDSTSNPLTTNSFVRPGFVFTGWNTAPDGSGTGYVDAEFYDFSSGDGVLYAQYSKAALAATGVDPSPAFELAMWFVAVGVTTMMTIALIGRRRRAAASGH